MSICGRQSPAGSGEVLRTTKTGNSTGAKFPSTSRPQRLNFERPYCHWLGIAPPIQLAGESSHGPFTPRNPSLADARFTIPLSTRTTIPRSCGDLPRCCGTRRSGSASATRVSSSVMRLSHFRTVMLGFSGVFGVCSRRCYPYRPSRANGLQPPLGLGDRSPSQAPTSGLRSCDLG